MTQSNYVQGLFDELKHQQMLAQEAEFKRKAEAAQFQKDLDESLDLLGKSFEGFPLLIMVTKNAHTDRRANISIDIVDEDGDHVVNIATIDYAFRSDSPFPEKTSITVRVKGGHIDGQYTTDTNKVLSIIKPNLVKVLMDHDL